VASWRPSHEEEKGKTLRRGELLTAFHFWDMVHVRPGDSHVALAAGWCTDVDLVDHTQL
jgi:hypothetical protein